VIAWESHKSYSVSLLRDGYAKPHGRMEDPEKKPILAFQCESHINFVTSLKISICKQV